MVAFKARNFVIEIWDCYKYIWVEFWIRMRLKFHKVVVDISGYQYIR